MLMELIYLLDVPNWQPLTCASFSSPCSPTSLRPSANIHVGYPSMPAARHLSGSCGHSTYGTNVDASPKRAFSAWQCEHHSAPYIVAPLSLRHCASAMISSEAGAGARQRYEMNPIASTRNPMVAYKCDLLITTIHQLVYDVLERPGFFFRRDRSEPFCVDELQAERPKQGVHFVGVVERLFRFRRFAVRVEFRAYFY